MSRKLDIPGGPLRDGGEAPADRFGWLWWTLSALTCALSDMLGQHLDALCAPIFQPFRWMFPSPQTTMLRMGHARYERHE